jgi:membrane-associated phospholipid phosphatase
MCADKFSATEVKHARLERAALTAMLVVLFITAYFGVGRSTNPAGARELISPLDLKIPFLASTVWLYLLVFPASLIPLFVVRCSRLFRRTALAYGIAIVISLIVFVAFPVTSQRLRVDAAMLDLTHASDWAVSTVYYLDPPYNLFPSLHLSIVLLAAYSAWKAMKTCGAVCFAFVPLVALSIFTVRQHVIVDGLGGFALAAVVGAVILRPYQPEDGTKPAYSWRGPALYVVFLAVVYTGFYVAFTVSG